MKLKYRLSIVTIGVIIFCLITPFLVFYARGFKLDLKTMRIERSGSLVIKTTPTKATINLSNGSEYESPAIIRFLKPDEYVIKISKENYQSWEKRLRINVDLVTWGNSEKTPITLFYNQPVLKQQIPIDFIWPSTEENKLAFYQDSKLTLLDTNTQSLVDLGLLDENFIQAKLYEKWSWKDLQKSYPTAISFIKKISNSQNINKILSNGDFIGYLSGKTLMTFIGGQGPLLVDIEVKDFALDANSIWYLKNQQLLRYNFDSKKSVVIAENLPQSDKQQIMREGSSVFYISDQKIYGFTDTVQPIFYPATFKKWDEASKTLTLGNDNEIAIFKSMEGKIMTVLRSSIHMHSPTYNQSTSNIFFIQENKIKAAELDERDRKNIFSLIDIRPDESYLLSDDGKTITVYSAKQIKIYQIR
jgi:hypothetical protein